MRETIGVIGSGMAGLASAWIMKQAGHEVTVFESLERRGMDAHTLDIPTNQKAGWVDVPLRVMSPMAWQSVLALGRQVGVDTFPVNTFVACCWTDQRTWFRSTRLPIIDLPFVGSWRFLNPTTIRMMQGAFKLASATKGLEAQTRTGLTLGQFLGQHRFDPVFWRGLVLPLLTTICTCKEEHLLAWPAQDLLALLRKIMFGDQLLRLKGGTRALVSALTSDMKFVSGSPVVSVSRQGASMRVKNARGDEREFDRVIIATQANQLDFLSQTEFPRERDLLQGIRFDTGELIVHSDTRLLPKNRHDWSALNYMVGDNFEESMFTVWVNAVEPSIKDGPNVFQSWNPTIEPKPELVQSRVPLQRAVVYSGTLGIQNELARLHAEPERKVFFAGSWAYPGVPLLESAVRSALAVAQQLNVKPNWDPSPVAGAQATS